MGRGRHIRLRKANHCCQPFLIHWGLCWNCHWPSPLSSLAVLILLVLKGTTNFSIKTNELWLDRLFFKNYRIHLGCFLSLICISCSGETNCHALRQHGTEAMWINTGSDFLLSAATSVNLEWDSHPFTKPWKNCTSSLHLDWHGLTREITLKLPRQTVFRSLTRRDFEKVKVSYFSS